jgi:hypothetical protein
MVFSGFLWKICEAPAPLTNVMAADSKGVERQKIGPNLAANPLRFGILKIEGKNEIFRFEGCPPGSLFSSVQ